MNHPFLRNVLLVTALMSFYHVAHADYTPADSLRFTKWNPGLNSVGGIPNRTQVSATVQASAYGNGSTEASSAIQSAIDNCPAGQVVQLSAGTFKVNNLVLISKGITLRGAGSGKTILQKTNGAIKDSGLGADAQPLIIIGPGRWVGPDSATSRNLAADANKGANSVTVANGAGFAAGQFVLLDELSGASWQSDRLGQGQVFASPDYRVVWKAHNPTIQYVDDFDATTGTHWDPMGWFCRYDRPTSEIKEVAGVSGNVITFTTPLHISYRTSHTAQLTRYTPTGNGGNGGVQVTYAGVEGLTVTGGSDGAIRFEVASYCWAKDVEVTIWVGEGIAVDNSYKCEVRDSYIHYSAVWQPGGGSYCISLADGSSEILVENCITVLADKMMVVRCCGAGSVFGYNYTDQGIINYSPGWVEIGLNASHMVGPHHVLFEGNYGFNWDSDNTHGNSIYMTVFRNLLSGFRSACRNQTDDSLIDDVDQQNNGPKRCIGAMSYSYWMTFVGNVLGTQGKMGGWEYDRSVANGWDAPGIWLLGWDGAMIDTSVEKTAVRDGNWDWLQSKQSWHNSTPVTLQNSLYLTGKPAFFGNCPWPWVTPEGTVKTAVLPAQARFNTIMFDSACPSCLSASLINGRKNTAGPAPFTASSRHLARSVVFDYSLDNSSPVRMEIIGINGKKLYTLVNEQKTAGNHSVVFNTSNVPAGIYFCRLTTNNDAWAGKFIVR